MKNLRDESLRIGAAFDALKEWYIQNQKALPWRQSMDPYAIWISETMLQQTRIETVIPYYLRFMKELPNLAALAQVEEDRLLKLWQGLGYYNRARNLKKAAVMIMEEYGGIFPRRREDLQRLPGVGAYTAGAISSLAFGAPEPAVDGNVLRVILRLTAGTEDISLEKTKRSVTERLRALYPSGIDSAILTQAWMELGENICLPHGKPKCELCPLALLCLARERNEIDVLPVRSPKKSRRIENRTVLLLHCQGRYAICQRKEKGLLAKLWEFPNFNGKFTREEAEKLCREKGMAVLSLSFCGEAKHIFTHIEWHMTGFFLEIKSPSSAYLWKTPEELDTQFAIPSAFQFYIKQIKEREK